MYNASIIGLGNIGLMYDFDLKRESPSSHALAYERHSDIKLVAAMDINPKQAGYLCQLAPRAQYYDDIILMLQQHTVDIISLCTPPAHHLIGIRTVLEKSSPRIIFCEKPVVNDREEIAELKALLLAHKCLLVPNLSRRWNSGIRCVRDTIHNQSYGKLQKMHIRYTRGIYNTGSHIFDLVRFFSGNTVNVQVTNRVHTSADEEGEPSFSFIFSTDNDVNGVAEAFNDMQYYMFEIDLYCEYGKIEIRLSGDEINYYRTTEHPLFSGFRTLQIERAEKGLLKESNLKNAVDHIVRVLDEKEQAICTLEDGVYPLYVAEALLRSFDKGGSIERVEVG